LASTSAAADASATAGIRRAPARFAIGSAPADSGSSTGSGSATGAAAAFAAFTRRAAAARAPRLVGSGAFFAGAPFLPLTTGVSANSRRRQRDVTLASQSLDELARDDLSIVLEALFASMP